MDNSNSDIWTKDSQMYNSKGYQSQDSAMISKPEILETSKQSIGLNEKLNAQ